MNYIPILFSVTILFIGLSANEVIQPLPSSRRMASPFFCGDETGYYCSNCNAMIFCHNKSSTGIQVSCRDLTNPGTPYCDPGRHVCSGVDMCMGMPSDFQCLEKGIYPDVIDCRRYIICSEVNTLGSYYACMAGKIYDTKVKDCVTNASCVSYSNVDGLCKDSYKVLSHVGKTIFVQCMGVDKPLMRSCQGRHYEYNEMTMKCQFECKDTGLFKDYDNPRGFFICNLVGGKWIKNILLCPPGRIFISFGYNRGRCEDVYITTDYSDTSTQKFITSEPLVSDTTTDYIVTMNNSDNNLNPGTSIYVLNSTFVYTTSTESFSISTDDVIYKTNTTSKALTDSIGTSDFTSEIYFPPTIIPDPISNRTTETNTTESSQSMFTTTEINRTSKDKLASTTEDDSDNSSSEED